MSQGGRVRFCDIRSTGAVSCGGGWLWSPLHWETRPGWSGSHSQDLTPTVPNDNAQDVLLDSILEGLRDPLVRGIGVETRKPSLALRIGPRGSANGAYYWATVGAVDMFHVKRVWDPGM